MTVVAGSTEVLIITGGLVHGKEAATLGVAGVTGTDVVVVARQGQPSIADGICAFVCQGTGVAIVTLGLIGNVLAARNGVTRIVGARIIVVTVEFGAALAAVLRVAAFHPVADIIIVTN